MVSDLEKKLISTIASSREAFTKMVPYLDSADWEWSVMGTLVYPSIKEFYDVDKQVSSVDWSIIQGGLEKELPKKGSLIREYIISLPNPASLPNTLKLLEDTKREKLGFALMQALSRHNEGEARRIMEEYLALDISEDKEEMYNSTPIETLAEAFQGKNIIPIYPTIIGDYIGGGLPRQSQVCIIGRPDRGKTVFAINMAVGAAENGYKVMYVANEDADKKVVLRIVSRFVREPESVIKASPGKWYEKALENGYANMYVVPMYPGSYREIRKWVERIKPDMVVVDQIRNVHFDKDNLTVNLEKAGKGMRNLAKEFNFVSVLVSQAGESAEEKLWLDMSDVDSSKTGLQGALDMLIAIGGNKELKEKNQIILNFPKNKLSATIKPITASIDYTTNTIKA